MTGTNYTVASNEQLLGGNLRNSCSCKNKDDTETTRQVFERIQIHVPETASQSPTDSITTVDTEILDLYACASEPSIKSSIDTEELIHSFPTPPTSNTTQRCTLTPDIWLDTEVTEPSITVNGVPESKESKTPLTGIYFSPLHISSSRCELSSPLNSPLSTPTQVSYDASVQRARSRSTERCTSPLAISVECLDRLIRSLACCDMIQDRLRTRIGRREMVRSESVDKSDPAIDHYNLQALYEIRFRNRLSTIKAPKAKFCGICLVDPNANGFPTSMMSRDFEIDTDVLSIDELSYSQSPQAPSIQCSLLMSGDEDDQDRVMLRIISKILGRTSGKLKYLLIVNVDVSESFTKAALFELLNTSATSSAGPTNLTETAIRSIGNLRSDTCTMQTLTLLSELDRIRDQFLDFYIVKTKETHENGVPSKLTVPYVSKGLDSSLSARDGENLRYLVVGMVGKYAVDGQAFTSEIEWDGERRRVHCVPLLDGSSGSELCWVCFARDGFDIGHW